MRRILKWIGIILGGLVVLVLLIAVVLSIIGGRQLGKTREVQAEVLTIPTSEAALARGEHLVVGPALCTECHGQDLSGGGVLLDDPTLGTVYFSNITGLSETHSDADMIRAIRHGVDKDGRQLVAMPADIFINFSAEDLGAIIAYLKTVPPVENDLPDPKLTFLGRAMLAAGMFGDVFPAEIIDHNKPFPAMPEVGANAEYGDYLAAATGCKKCHGEDLGGQVFDPEAPKAPNLTQGGELIGWSEEDFIQTIRTGVSPSGHKLDLESMPWKNYAKMDDDELKGLWMYLKSLPAVRSGE